MQTTLHFPASRSFTPHKEVISLPTAQLITTGLSLLVAIAALAELALA